MVEAALDDALELGAFDAARAVRYGAGEGDDGAAERRGGEARVGDGGGRRVVVEWRAGDVRRGWPRRQPAVEQINSHTLADRRREDAAGRLANAEDLVGTDFAGPNHLVERLPKADVEHDRRKHRQLEAGGREPQDEVAVVGTHRIEDRLALDGLEAEG